MLISALLNQAAKLRLLFTPFSEIFLNVVSLSNFILAGCFKRLAAIGIKPITSQSSAFQANHLTPPSVHIYGINIQM